MTDKQRNGRQEETEGWKKREPLRMTEDRPINKDACDSTMQPAALFWEDHQFMEEGVMAVITAESTSCLHHSSVHS